jgi:hypothetical protein
MQIRALDNNFVVTDIIDAYESAIWTEYYNGVGDFEIKGPLNDQLLGLISDAVYVFNTVTTTFMVIEKVAISYEKEKGAYLTITGRSGVSILDRRIFLKANTIQSASDQLISQILCDKISESFSLTDNTSHRYWGRLQLVDATTTNRAKLTANVPLEFSLGANLLTVVNDLCVANKLGYKFTFDVVTRIVKCVFYEGLDRTTTGEEQVVFSDLYDNLISSKEQITSASMRNAALVVGNAEDPITKLPRLPQIVEDASKTGIDRRELYLKIDQQDIKYNSAGVECPMTVEEYVAKLVTAGTQTLANPGYGLYRDYEGEILETRNFMFGTDFNLGDIVAFRVGLLPLVPARLEGVTFSDDAGNGKTLAPKFSYDV